MIQDRAMLIRVTLRSFNPYKRDRGLAQTAASSVGADFNYVNATKRLVPRSAYKDIQNNESDIRQCVYHNTRPWFDEGWRILPTPSFFDVTDRLNQRFAKREQLISKFASEWPVIQEAVKLALNGAYREEDFPVDIAERFSHDVAFMPIPREGDFRAPEGIDADDIAKIESATLSRVSEQFKSTDLWKRVYDAVEHISERLHSYGTNPDGKVVNRFHDTLIENLRDLVTVLPKLNIAADPELDKMHKRLNTELCAYDPQTLRDNDFVRESVATKADQILAEVSAWIT